MIDSNENQILILLNLLNYIVLTFSSVILFKKCILFFAFYRKFA
jgi:hypothetical protein